MFSHAKLKSNIHHFIKFTLTCLIYLPAVFIIVKFSMGDHNMENFKPWKKRITLIFYWNFTTKLENHATPYVWALKFTSPSQVRGHTVLYKTSCNILYFNLPTKTYPMMILGNFKNYKFSKLEKRSIYVGSYQYLTLVRERFSFHFKKHLGRFRRQILIKFKWIFYIIYDTTYVLQPTLQACRKFNTKINN